MSYFVFIVTFQWLKCFFGCLKSVLRCLKSVLKCLKLLYKLLYKPILHVICTSFARHLHLYHPPPTCAWHAHDMHMTCTCHAHDMHMTCMRMTCTWHALGWVKMSPYCRSRAHTCRRYAKEKKGGGGLFKTARVFCGCPHSYKNSGFCIVRLYISGCCIVRLANAHKLLAFRVK